MKRKIGERFSAWRDEGAKKPLVLLGARQTGKTTSVLAFGRENYADVAHVDFVKRPQLKAAFDGDIEPNRIVANLEALMRRDIVPGRTLLFFDEAQECDRALASLKYFCQDMPALDVVAAGSLLGVHVARRESFPVGYVNMCALHPMSFEEFCWALGEGRAFDLARASMADFSACAAHERLCELYREYLLVGGMPEAVLVHAQGGSLERVRRVQSDIRTAYVADMTKYATGADSVKIVASWESMPAQLAKESGSTKFMWKHVASGANAERYGTAVDWLVAAGLVNKCTQVSAGVSPLKSFENSASFKLYVGDTGLLSCAYDAIPQDFDGADHRSARFRGGMAENYVMQQLVACGAKPYYWGQQSTYEVEFVVSLRGRITPIEVKSGRRVKSTSAARFAEKYGCARILRLSMKNFGIDGAVCSVPLYAACLLAKA
ncbi:MAG: ATP-binding protein [Eggerthellaceae bacterium]|nr:ATP-binding protein [Eggerthellaceae bacterium]